eukprot:Blabericola_migrator_1__3718@NODE_2112_length_3253_cov_429_439109_g1337_i0_p2_GENE_NODE_2112_length_3253_cov_429_439109_g1337_i0NODE_2112_length_3253_cov_429_439109_g1337_i0_p2_ORF_typecomplete_len250_score48_58PP1c_bdg/PF10488_9/0_11CPDase/PF07823_11/0_13_NODE_2112_length_3253_cov_429_439109_g1337_i013302079
MPANQEPFADNSFEGEDELVLDMELGSHAHYRPTREARCPGLAPQFKVDTAMLWQVTMWLSKIAVAVAHQAENKLAQYFSQGNSPPPTNHVTAATQTQLEAQDDPTATLQQVAAALHHFGKGALNWALMKLQQIEQRQMKQTAHRRRVTFSEEPDSFAVNDQFCCSMEDCGVFEPTIQRRVPSYTQEPSYTGSFDDDRDYSQSDDFDEGEIAFPDQQGFSPNESLMDQSSLSHFRVSSPLADDEETLAV